MKLLNIDLEILKHNVFVYLNITILKHMYYAVMYYTNVSSTDRLTRIVSD